MNNPLGQLPFQTGAVTRMINAENPTGEKGGGARWDPNPDDPFLAHSGAAQHLGRGWKVRPFISLKAGGLGLNLTAAEYVFLLDPWWNPAVEAQAVDRAHRIGQTRPVFAYRLIARDTVEEKVLELQKTKRELADAILGEDNSLIRDLKREDLELLLS